MPSNLTEIIFIIDKSTSMEPIREQTIAAFNKFLEDQQREPGRAMLTLVFFSSSGKYETRYSGADIRRVNPLTAVDYVPDGMTALSDAIGKTINETGARLEQTPESERPAHVLVAILTDGAENDSKDYTVAKIKEKILHQETKYSWKFLFLGAGLQDAVQAVAGAYGIGGLMCCPYNADAQGIAKSVSSVSCATSQLRTSGAIDAGWVVEDGGAVGADNPAAAKP